jgi:hypothetical protein
LCLAPGTDVWDGRFDDVGQDERMRALLVIEKLLRYELADEASGPCDKNTHDVCEKIGLV